MIVMMIIGDNGEYDKLMMMMMMIMIIMVVRIQIHDTCSDDNN